jgi:hypothetical protein
MTNKKAEFINIDMFVLDTVKELPAIRNIAILNDENVRIILKAAIKVLHNYYKKDDVTKLLDTIRLNRFEVKGKICG